MVAECRLHRLNRQYRHSRLLHSQLHSQVPSVLLLVPLTNQRSVFQRSLRLHRWVQHLLVLPRWAQEMHSARPLLDKASLDKHHRVPVHSALHDPTRLALLKDSQRSELVVLERLHLQAAILKVSNLPLRSHRLDSLRLRRLARHPTHLVLLHRQLVLSVRRRCQMPSAVVCQML